MDFQAFVQQTVDFVRHNQAWAVPVVFALAFGESLAFISLLLPAWGALVAIGALIGSSGIKFWPIWVAASLGAAFGDWVSYWIGLKLEYRVAHMWPLSRHPDLIPRGEIFMKMEKTHFANRFAMLRDRFGTSWMLLHEPAGD